MMLGHRATSVSSQPTIGVGPQGPQITVLIHKTVNECSRQQACCQLSSHKLTALSMQSSVQAVAMCTAAAAAHGTPQYPTKPATD
jgi:hypothetical protein